MSSKSDINSLWEGMVKDIDENGYLDHEIRAVEKMISDRFSVEKEVIRFKVYKHQSTRAGISKSAGCAFIQRNYTATILYSSDGNRLEKILAIGHELGHIALNHVRPNVPGDTSSIKDEKLETEATYFAKVVATRRLSQYESKDFYNSRHFELDEIDKTIKAMNMVYDESKLE